ncbi:methyltransferase [Permianibacter sp. IMCC34836]|uniref:methyltransferase n=1 Tax=Permianibacter fluminis TaxID=2738515 RepID=UPI001554F049|nr:methyltransferase [Permianibacter fluminis]NQD35522.1 methyltransferase [Permianibacter fluminis]
MSLATRFADLTALLRQYEPFWRPSPFVHPVPAWCADYPALAADCHALTDAALAALEADPSALMQWLIAREPALAALPPLLEVPTSAPAVTDLPNLWAKDIPGRKWQQIAAFAAQVPALEPKLESELELKPTAAGTLLDWCSGKAHLGRTLAQVRRQPLLAVERDANLCAAGAALAQQAGVAAEFVCADVLQDEPSLPASAQVLALHACGDLHRRLLQRLAQQPVQALTLAPCCYHLWLKENYVPLSALARGRDLQLDRNSVQLAVQEAVTSSHRIRSRSETLAAWRLGFDSLQRELRGKDEYLTTPSLPQSVLLEGFESLCRRIAAHKNLPLPANVDWPHYQALGVERHRRAQRLQGVRHGFRRAIELWLVLDLALYLEQLGYQVELSEFCPRELTPRNLLLRARANQSAAIRHHRNAQPSQP